MQGTAALQRRNRLRLESPAMPAQEDTKASPTGPVDELDIAALYARLRQEIRRTGAVDRSDSGRHGARAAVRGFAERYWAVTAERPLERRPGLKGALSFPMKRLLLPFLRWYVEPLAYEQRMFNDAALKLIDALYEEIDLGARIEDQAQRLGRRLDEVRYGLSERVDEEAASLERAARLLGEVEERLTRAERRTDGGAPRTVAPQ